MGKQGPCYHCGVASTPLWRNGPPEKPILCNACGSRWRTKGTLANYTPLHSRAEADDYEDQRLSKVKTTSHKIGDEKLKKRKPIYENSIGERFASDYNQGFMKSADEDARNSSSSGSAGSNSESFLPFSSTDASDLTDPAQSAVWETQFPSKKRTCITRTKSSPVEKLLKDLHAILHEQESSCLSGSPEEDLLFGSDVPMVSVEIGHGSVLIKHPSSFVQEEDSEASSLSFENRPCAVSESCSLSASFSGSNGFNGGNVCKNRSSNVTKFTSDMTRQEVAKRDQFNHDRMQHFLTNNSPLCYIDLNDVINFEVLMRHFTSEEQQQLLKYLPRNDTFKLPGSLENMFDSPCFKENLIYFQQLLSAGVFSSSYSGDKLDDFKALKMLALSNLTKSKWLELYIKLKDSKSLTHTQEIEIESGGKLGSSKDLRSTKRPLQEQNPNMPGNETTECPKQGSFFTPGSLFHLPTSECCMKMDSCHQEFSDQDLLLDVPSNGSFPEAELLLPPLSARSHQTTTSSNSIDYSTMVHH